MGNKCDVCEFCGGGWLVGWLVDVVFVVIVGVLALVVDFREVFMT